MTATISLTFDDGLDSHLDVALPLLEQAGMRGTFYVNIRAASLGPRGGEWREAAARGHELGNHSLLHPAVRAKAWVREANALEDYSLDRMRMELEVANNVLRALDGRTERTFAFPCSNPVLGRPGLLTQSLVRLGLDRTRLMSWVRRSGFDPGSRAADFTPMVRELFYAARCGGVPPDAVPYDMPDRHRVRSVQADAEPLERLAAAVDRAAETAAWLVFSFHGIGGGHRLYSERTVFEGLIARIAADRRVAVRTFLDAAKARWGEDPATARGAPPSPPGGSRR